MRFVLRFLPVAAVGCVFLTVGLSCAKKSTRPPTKPVEYRLYAGVIQPWELGGRCYIYTIDTETDSIIDSVEYDGSYLRLNASPDGKYLKVGGGNPNTRIYDPSNLSILTEFDDRYLVAFVPEANVIVGAHHSMLKFHDYHTFADQGQDTPGFEFPQVLPGQTIAYGTVPYRPVGPDSTGFVMYDCRERKIVRLWHRFSRADGTSHRGILHFDVHPDGRRVYGNSVTTAGTSQVFGYDLEGDSTIFEHPLFASLGYVRVSPDGKEVYCTDPGVPGIDYTPGKIFIYDADDGAPLHEISLWGIDTVGGGIPLYAYDIRFHPEKPKVYVRCGESGKRLGPILVIDTKTRKITRLIFSNLDHVVLSIDIGPVR